RSPRRGRRHPHGPGPPGGGGPSWTAARHPRSEPSPEGPGDGRRTRGRRRQDPRAAVQVGLRVPLWGPGGQTPADPARRPAVGGVQAATERNPRCVEHSLLYLAESESLLGGGGGHAQASYTEEDLELAQSVRGLIGRRIQRLSEPAQRMLVAAGVIGRDFDIPLLESFGELSGHELRDALDEATRGHFIVASGKDSYRFA